MQPQPPVTPTQTAHPWRATVRTVVAAIVGALFLLPIVVSQLGVDGVPWVAAVVAIAGTVTRVLAIPAVNAFITEYLPWLAPTPRQP